MSLARGILKGPPSARGVRNEPLATGGDPLPQLGTVHEKAVEKETVAKPPPPERRSDET